MLLVTLLILFPASVRPVVTAAETSPAGAVMFETHVRPILKTNCFHCHGEGDKLQSGLDLRLRRLIVKGGETGPAIVPGKPAESTLLEYLQDGEMPPPEIEKRLTSNEIAMVERWIAEGAKTAGVEPEKIDSGFYVTEQERNFWSFQPLVRHIPPEVNQQHRVRTPIDQFVLARLEAKGLGFSDDAAPQVLLRRLYLDLTGLPPTAEETDAFTADRSPGSYQRLVDQLLASPRYGERWGRHWLDVAGYADSEGVTDTDVVRTEAYKYRDYVIHAMNQDQPFDKFIQEQLAGDEMVTPPYREMDATAVRRLTATGFLRMAADGTGSDNQPGVRNQVVTDTLKIVSTSLLGLTVGCAQCHNHRYDPISQADYYRFRAIFEPAFNWQDWRTPSKRRITLYTDADRTAAAEIEKQAKVVEADRAKKQEEYIEATFQRELAKLTEALRPLIVAARNVAADKRTAAQKKLLKDNPTVNVTAGSLYLYDKKAADDLSKYAEKAKKIRNTKPVEEFLRATWEPAGKELPVTHRFERGDFEQPKESVEPAGLAILGREQAGIPAKNPGLTTSGRRLAYAQWLTSKEHPLLARVLVNRVWMHHMGRGIVQTPGDFGFLGVLPTHPQLLDWLATEFMQQGWSLKQLHRLVVTSTVYRQSSVRTPDLDAVDRENRFYGAMSMRRLEAEALRDSILAVSGMLNGQAAGQPVPVMADRDGQWVIGKENLNAGRPGPVVPMLGQEFRRSLYIQVRRSRPLAVLSTFDLPRMDPNCTVRASSTVAPQALMLMNSDFVTRQARYFAQRLQKEIPGDVPAQVGRAWKLAFSESAAPDEVTAAVQFLQQQAQQFEKQVASSTKKKKTDPAAEKKKHELAALASFCHALLSSNQFLYVE
ncbi:MAG: PSD1 and planctomycete cytochrome C domain-containing protein [Pirellulaceae bacterium]